MLDTLLVMVLTARNRPAWTKDTTAIQLDRQERDAFLEWRRGLAELAEKEDLLLTPFERNLEVWRQLWRVLERSHLVVQIVDARNPLRFRCEDLEAYVADIEGPEGEKSSGKKSRKSLLLVNKADLLTKAQRIAWAEHFDANGVTFAFYSAAAAAALQDMPLREEGIRVAPSADDVDNSDEGEKDGSDSESEEHLSSPPDSNGHETDDSSQQEESQHDADPRIRVLTVKELEDLFLQSAPPLTGTYYFLLAK
jgi:large subunit GTPase 1